MIDAAWYWVKIPLESSVDRDTTFTIKGWCSRFSKRSISCSDSSSSSLTPVMVIIPPILSGFCASATMDRNISKFMITIILMDAMIGTNTCQKVGKEKINRNLNHTHMKLYHIILIFE